MPAAAWAWSAAEASATLATRDLATILRAYRRANRLSQEGLAAELGYDKTYVCMIETRRRTINDVASRRHIASVLGLPPHVLDVTDTGDGDVTSMLEFGESVVRLADVARRSGRATDAIAELWPLLARLESRAAGGRIERDGLRLLGRARICLGVCLGTVLCEERLTAAARWTGRGLAVARRLDDSVLLAHALRMHGNELRKAGFGRAALVRLEQAVGSSADPPGRGIACAFLARAAGAQGAGERFDRALAGYRDALDRYPGDDQVLSPFGLREVQLRGLMDTGRHRDAVRTLGAAPVDVAPTAPQWRVIERVTTGRVLLAAGDRSGAAELFRGAVRMAETYRLPHQIQRVASAAGDRLPDVVAEGMAALERLDGSRVVTAG